MKKIIVIAIIFILQAFLLSSCQLNNPQDNNQNSTENVTQSPDANTNDNQEDNTQDGDMNDNLKISISIGKNTYTATLYNNASAKAFANLLPLSVKMSDMPHEKYYYLPENLPADAQKIQNINAGDLMLWGNSCFVVFYETFSTSYSYTKIGKIDNPLNLGSLLKDYKGIIEIKQI